MDIGATPFMTRLLADIMAGKPLKPEPATPKHAIDLANKLQLDIEDPWVRNVLIKLPSKRHELVAKYLLVMQRVNYYRRRNSAIL